MIQIFIFIILRVMLPSAILSIVCIYFISKTDINDRLSEWSRANEKWLMKIYKNPRKSITKKNIKKITMHFWIILFITLNLVWFNILPGGWDVWIYLTGNEKVESIIIEDVYKKHRDSVTTIRDIRGREFYIELYDRTLLKKGYEVEIRYLPWSKLLLEVNK